MRKDKAETYARAELFSACSKNDVRMIEERYDVSNTCWLAAARGSRTRPSFGLTGMEVVIGRIAPVRIISRIIAAPDSARPSSRLVPPP
jgi:hypothetical protein